MSRRRGQRGAALIVVLLMAATVSFIVLALVSAMSQSARRTAGAAVRGEILWRVASAEVIAEEAIAEAYRLIEQGGPKLTLEHPLYSRQLDIPYADGGGAIVFADATRCFNLNIFAGNQNARENRNETDSGAQNRTPSAELIALFETLGVNAGDASNLTAAIKDFIDSDNTQEIGGAEDSFYTGLPVPFRTAGGAIAHISELRAIRGVNAELYALISPYLCAAPETEPMVVNVNTLRPVDAPILAAITYGELDAAEAEALILDRPPGGWTTIEQFLTRPELNSQRISQEELAPRVALTSRYIEAIAGASVNEIDMNARLMFRAAPGGGEIALVSRELGTNR